MWIIDGLYGFTHSNTVLHIFLDSTGWILEAPDFKRFTLEGPDSNWFTLEDRKYLIHVSIDISPQKVAHILVFMA